MNGVQGVQGVQGVTSMRATIGPLGFVDPGIVASIITGAVSTANTITTGVLGTRQINVAEQQLALQHAAQVQNQQAAMQQAQINAYLQAQAQAAAALDIAQRGQVQQTQVRTQAQTRSRLVQAVAGVLVFGAVVAGTVYAVRAARA